MWHNGEPDRRSRLREVHDIRQHKGERRRRWFSCAAADLYVWQDDNGDLSSFELCYDKPRDEHALRWSEDAGFSHTRIDDGESSPLKNYTPIVVPDGRFDPTEIALTFEAIASAIDSRVYRFVLGKLHGGA